MKSAFFAGSFNPFTIGHRDIVERALTLFDRVVIAIGVNSTKPRAYSPETEAERIRQYFADTPGVEVIIYDGLTAEAARRQGCTHLLRSVRSVTDFEYEKNLADANRNIFGLETFILYARPELAHISSSLVRELQAYGQDITPFLPKI